MPERTAAPAAVLFDMDGVLVDSYRPHLRSWQRVAAEEGLPFREEDFARAFGKKSRETIVAWWPGVSSRVMALDARKEALYRAEIAVDLPVMDGARELLRALHDAGLRLAVASSGPPPNVEAVLDGLGARDLFDAVVTGRDVARGKPDPQVFLEAARRLGVPPARCVVVEDAPVGVRAAHAGGMAAIALLSTGRRAEDFTADPPARVVGSLREVTPAVIAEILAGRAAGS